MLTDKYVNPFTDFGFKRLFGSEPNKELLIDFLNQILPENHQISNLTYANNEQLGASEVDRKAIFDIHCVAPSGERFIVELQKAKQNYFKDRSVFYASFPVQEQAKKGDWNFKPMPVYTVGTLDFVFDDSKEDNLLTIVKLKNQDGEVFLDKLTSLYLQLPLFTKSDAELASRFEKWMYVFRHLAELQNRPALLQERVFKKLFEATEVAAFSPQEKTDYESSLKYFRDLSNVVDTSREEGREEGRLLGLQEGAKAQRLAIAKKMKAEGFEVVQIAQITGLAETETKRL